MKNQTALVIMFFVSVISCSCSSLEITPTDFISPETYFTTRQEAEIGLTGVYSALGEPGTYLYHDPTNFIDGTDEAFYPRVNQVSGLAVNVISPEHNDVNNRWTGLYTAINRANVLIQNLENGDLPMEEVSDIYGETLALRAYYYFLLVINWGDVPLKTQPTQSVNSVDIGRTPAHDVYAQIISDLESAESRVKSATAVGHGGRLNKSAVQALLARVNIHWAGYPLRNTSRYEEAKKWAERVIASGEHALNPSYSQIFINQCQDEYDIQEVIWEVEFWGNRLDNSYLEAGRIGSLIGIACNNSAIGVCYDRANGTLKLFDAYEVADDGQLLDLRRDWAIAPFRYAGATKVAWSADQKLSRNAGKWRREYETLTPKSANYTPINYPLIRYADVLLMFAEAENAINGPTMEALEAVNKVRRRGYGKPVDLPDSVADIQTQNQETFLTTIQDERLRELCFEGLRRHDLLRWGIFLEACAEEARNIEENAPQSWKYAAFGINSLEAKNKLLPVPSSEMNLNNLIKQQNEGW